MKNFNKSNYITYLVASVFALAFILGGPRLIKAETATSTIVGSPQVCELNKALDELLAVKDSAITGLARDRAEFKVRKAVIEQTIICAREEIQQTKMKLEALIISAPEDEALRSQFIDSLTLSSVTYDEYSQAMATSTGLIDIKKLAEDILDWRKNEYIPMLSQVNDFILVINNDQSIKVARARFDKIKSTISILRLSNVASIRNLLDDSAQLTTKAIKLNNDAHTIVLTYFVPVEPVGLESTSSLMLIATGTLSLASYSENSTETLKETKKNIETSLSASSTLATSTSTVVTLVKSSIGFLKGAYTNYLKISISVRNILGL